uniref:Uncharacterized protein n=1 Tax=Strongyloides venezuelensis TaxID=75913 RepID=A0A0K0G3H0_STRVS
MIIKLTKSHRPTGLPERVNTRILKLAPKVIQEQSQQLENEDSLSTVPTDTSINIQSPINNTDNLPKRGRDRPKKITTTFNIKENKDTTTWKHSAFDRNLKACKENVNPREAVVTISRAEREGKWEKRNNQNMR